MPELSLEPAFWIGLGKIMLINIILSGDNAVVIALAARSLPELQRKQAIIGGSIAAILMRIALTFGAGELLQMPYLKLLGSLLLIWIGVKLLSPEEEDIGSTVHSHNTLAAAIRTILLADLVMSLDNVLAVAGAAQGDTLLLGIGLMLSIPIVIFGSTVVMRLMDKFSVIITLGGAILGYVAGEMLATEPALDVLNMQHALHTYAPYVGAILVVAIGKSLVSMRSKRTLAPLDDLVTDTQQRHSQDK